MPVENEEFQKITEEQAFKIFKPKEKVRFIDKVSGKMLRAGNVLPGEKSAFVVSILVLYLFGYFVRY